MACKRGIQEWGDTMRSLRQGGREGRRERERGGGGEGGREGEGVLFLPPLLLRVDVYSRLLTAAIHMSCYRYQKRAR